MTMRKHITLGLVAAVAFLVSSVRVSADLAGAEVMMAELGAAVVQAASDLSAAGTDLGISAAAKDKLAGLIQALDKANGIYETYIASGGQDTAAYQALQALYLSATGQDKMPGEEGEGRLPNRYEVPWESDAKKAIDSKAFEIANEASSKGGSEFAELDATPN